MVKIKIISEPSWGPTSYYRTSGPLSNLKNVSLEIMREVDWSKLADCDIIYMENPRKIEHLQCLTIAKNMRKKVWVDYDDNLFHVKEDNPNRTFFYQDETRSSIIKALTFADCVTVSTQGVFDEYKKYNKKISVIPNAFNDYWLTLRKEPARNRIINWRGGESHRKNIAAYKSQLKKFESDKWVLNFIGKNLGHIDEEIECNVATGYPIFEYFHEIRALSPKIQMILLEDTVFDRCRSNIAWLEATYSGSVTIAPPFPEWEKPGVKNVSVEHFAEALKDLCENESRLNELYEQSYSAVQQDYLLSKVNKLREDKIEWLLS